MVESEKSESCVSESVPAKTTKAKASSAQQQQQQQSQSKGNGDLVRLEKAYRSWYRGYRGRGRLRGYWPGRRQAPIPPGKPEGWNRLYFWCRDFATFGDANHPIKECPCYKEVRKERWQHQQQTSPSQPANPVSQNPTPEGNQ